MSSLLNYYSDKGRVTSSGNISTDVSMPQDQCGHFYFAQSPMGWYHDLGNHAVGKRPVRQRYEVGNPTCLGPVRYPPTGRFNCRQPCWTADCQ